MRAFLFGIYDTNLLDDAALCKDQRLVVDFLTGAVRSGSVQPIHVDVLKRVPQVLDGLLKKNGGSLDQLLQADVTFFAGELGFDVAITDIARRSSKAEYDPHGGRLRTLDMSSQLRRKPVMRTTAKSDR